MRISADELAPTEGYRFPLISTDMASFPCVVLAFAPNVMAWTGVAALDLFGMRKCAYTLIPHAQYDILDAIHFFLDRALSEYGWEHLLAIASGDVYQDGHQRNIIPLTRVTNAIKAEAMRRGVRYFEPSISEINAALGIPAGLSGKGRQKELMKLGRARLGNDINQHEADACAIAWCAWQMLVE